MFSPEPKHLSIINADDNFCPPVFCQPFCCVMFLCFKGYLFLQGSLNEVIATNNNFCSN